MERIVLRGKLVACNKINACKQNSEIHDAEIELPEVRPEQLKEGQTVLLKCIISQFDGENDFCFGSKGINGIVAILEEPKGEGKSCHPDLHLPPEFNLNAKGCHRCLVCGNVYFDKYPEPDFEQIKNRLTVQAIDPDLLRELHGIVDIVQALHEKVKQKGGE